MKGEYIKPIDVLGVLEFGNTAIGYAALDAVVKAAPVEVLRVVTVTPGKMIVFFTGDVASVEASIKRGADQAGESLVDSLLLPWVHEAVGAKLFETTEHSRRGGITEDSFGFFDAATIASGISALDRAVKETGVSADLIRFDNSMGGRVSIHISGDLHTVETAIDVARNVLEPAGRLVQSAIVANPHPEMIHEVVRDET